MNQDSKVAVIGAGIMGEALISALISSGVKPELITISEKRADRSAELDGTVFNQASTVSNQCCRQQMRSYWWLSRRIWLAVLEEIKGSTNPGAVVISFAAGKTISFII